MLRRRSIIINRTIKNNYHSSKIKFNSNYREWIKLFLSALISFMIGLCTIVLPILHNTKFFYTYFLEVSLIECDFTGALWTENSIDFTSTNLSGAIISNEQLGNSTLYNCILPNGTWKPIRTDNLIVHGDAEQSCTNNGPNMMKGWNVANGGYINVFTYSNQNTTEDFAKCYFQVTSFNTPRCIAFMYQFVELDNFSLLISSHNVHYEASANFQCFDKQYAYIELRFIDRNSLRYAGTYKGEI
ncbi:unnamed protein product [Rotaria sp. Silwood1]|nr:unnamed protein product [Rotaria sp. Silwood1]